MTMKLMIRLFNYRIALFRFTGTIVGVGDFSSQWTDSTWRSLKVSNAKYLIFHSKMYLPINMKDEFLYKLR